MSRIDFLKTKLLVTRLCAAMIAVAGAVAAYPAHRSFVSLIGGILMGYLLVWFGGEIRETARRLEEEKATKDALGGGE